MAQLSVGGGQVAGAAAVDNPLIGGGQTASGNIALPQQMVANGAVGLAAVTGAQAEAATLVGNPIPVAFSDGTNAQTPNVNSVKELSVNVHGRKKTYSFNVINYAASIASQTDILSIIGSASKIVEINRMTISGQATANVFIDVSCQKRSTANTGSTPVLLTATPHDSTTPSAAAATSTCTTYTVTNPTLGSAVGSGLRSFKLMLAKADGTGGFPPPIVDILFGKDGGQAIALHGVAENFCINLGGVSAPAGTTLNITVEITEI